MSSVAPHRPNLQDTDNSATDSRRLQRSATFHGNGVNNLVLLREKSAEERRRLKERWSVPDYNQQREKLSYYMKYQPYFLELVDQNSVLEEVEITPKVQRPECRKTKSSPAIRVVRSKTVFGLLFDSESDEKPQSDSQSENSNKDQDKRPLFRYERKLVATQD